MVQSSDKLVESHHGHPLLELAERCEKAPGADRELDYEIAECLHPFLSKHGYVRRSDDRGWHSSTPPIPGGELVGRASEYTSSIDAAMTLVPEGAEVEMTNLYCVAHAKVGLNFSDGSIREGTNHSNSLSLALCAAALRARHALSVVDRTSANKE